MAVAAAVSFACAADDDDDDEAMAENAAAPVDDDGGVVVDTTATSSSESVTKITSCSAISTTMDGRTFMLMVAFTRAAGPFTLLEFRLCVVWLAFQARCLWSFMDLLDCGLNIEIS